MSETLSTNRSRRSGYSAAEQEERHLRDVITREFPETDPELIAVAVELAMRTVVPPRDKEKVLDRVRRKLKPL